MDIFQYIWFYNFGILGIFCSLDLNTSHVLVLWPVKIMALPETHHFNTFHVLVLCEPAFDKKGKPLLFQYISYFGSILLLYDRLRRLQISIHLMFWFYSIPHFANIFV